MTKRATHYLGYLL
jgi:hypothetical protein